MPIIIRNSQPDQNGRKRYHVIFTGKNNEILSSSENLNSKQSCLKNITAMAKNFGLSDTSVRVMDETVKKPKVLFHKL